MSGIKYILRNECTSPALITYQNYSNQLWQYQVEFLPGQTRTIWATEGTLSYDLTKTCIKVLSKTVYPSTSTTPSQPSTNPNVSYTNQYLIQVSTMATSNNFEYSVLNYQNATIVGPIDLGFNTNDFWYLDYTYQTLNGWMVVFFNDDNDDKKVYFINKTGSINYVYEASTNDLNTDIHSNRFGTLIDYDNNVFIFSDFSTTYTYDIPSNWDDFYVDYNYDSGNYAGIIVYQEINNYSEYILFKPSGYQTLFNFNNNDYYINSIVYYKSNFFSILVYSQNDNKYSFYNVYNSNGVLINSINIEANSLTSVNSVNLNTPTVSTGITNIFAVEPSTTSGSGTGVTVQVSITTGTVNSVTLYGRGSGYTIGDTITINGSQIGGSSGVDNITLTVSSLGNFDLNDYDIQTFGDGKINMVFWNYFDYTVPYFIVIYDGISNEFYTTSHDRDALLYVYYDWWQYYTYLDDESSYNQPSNDFHIQFNDDDGSYDGDLYSVDDCDIVSWFDSTKEFSVYEFAKDANYDYYISTYYNYVGKSLILYANRDNGYISYEIFQPTGHTSINVITTGVLDSWNLNDIWIGDKYGSSFDLVSSRLMFIHNYDGTQIDMLYYDNNDWDWYGEYNSLFLVDYDNGLSYYWNNSVNSILPTPFYNNWDDINYYNTTSQINNGQQLLWNYNNKTSQVLTQNTLSIVRTLPVIGGNDYDIRITKNLVGLVTSNNGGKLVVYVYDLNYNLLNTVTTNETNWNNFAAQENRIYLQTDDGNNYVHYLITANTFKKVVTSNENTTFRYNDWQ
jgi:hypothetical protein